MIFVDKNMLVDTIFYYEFLQRDGLYQEDIFSDPIEIKYVRAELTESFTRSSNEDQNNPTAVIFAYGKHTTPLPNFKEKSKIKIQGVAKEFYIKKVIIYSDITKSAFSGNGIFSVELELV